MRPIVGILTLCFAFGMTGIQAATPPFKVQNTIQVFQKTTTGGIHQIVAKDPNDKHLISDISAYLLQEAAAFGKGEYGSGTPAAAYLSAIKPGQLRITFRQVPGGAAVDYVGRDAASVDAIHRWLDAEIDAQD